MTLVNHKMAEHLQNHVQLKRLRIVSSAVLAAAAPGDSDWALGSAETIPADNWSSSGDESGQQSRAAASSGSSSSSSSSAGNRDSFRETEANAGDLWQRLAAVRTALRDASTASSANIAAASRVLLVGLRDASPQVRAAAAKSLGACSALAAGALQAEITVMGLSSAALTDSDGLVREAAAEALGHHSSSGSSVDISDLTETLVRVALEDPFWPVRAAALRSLARLAGIAESEGGRSAPQIASAAASLLVDESWQVRWQAAEALRAAGPAAGEHPDALLEALTDPVWMVRRSVAAALAASANGAGTRGLILALEGDEDHRVREEAAGALGSSQSTDNGARAAGALANALLADQSLEVRVAAVRGLAALGSASARHGGTLARQLQGGNAALRSSVHEFFRTVTGPHAAAFSATFEPDSFKDVTSFAEAARRAREAALALSPLTDAVEPYVERFANSLLSPFLQAREEAEQALAALGAAAVPYMVERVAGARDGDFRRRMAAMRGLSCTGVLPHDSACAFLAEWIYQPSVDTLPVSGLELVVLQTPQEHLGINLQWAVLRGTHGTFRGQCFLVFRGSETALDWTENSYTALKGVEIPRWGVLLLHSGFWSAVEGERDRLSAALAKAAEGMPMEVLVLCGGSKGGANALATSALLLAPRLGQLEASYRCLLVVTFGAPNIAGRGNDAQGSTSALNYLRDALREKAPRSRSWVFTEDPIPAFMSGNSGAVLDEYGQGARWFIKALQYLRPETYRRAKGYFMNAVKVTQTLEPLLPEEPLVAPPSVRAKRKSRFDASVHPQLNYTEALCRRMLGQELPSD